MYELCHWFLNVLFMTLNSKITFDIATQTVPVSEYYIPTNALLYIIIYYSKMLILKHLSVLRLTF